MAQWLQFPRRLPESSEAKSPVFPNIKKMLSLYVHIPFCVGKCHYCGFYSTLYSRDAADEYIAALLSEGASKGRVFGGREVGSVYFGGGTPTALAPYQLRKVLAMVSESFNINAEAECTMEVNPATALEEKLSILRENGVNRISMGVQSFDDQVLRSLGRVHTGKQAEAAFRTARHAGFENIGLDLIYGIPDQSMEQWLDCLDQATGLSPEHISLYGLSLDEGSRFSERAEGGAFALPVEEMYASQYERGVAVLEGTGYERYEISNFSRPGRACRHNLHYWSRGEYIGLGAGASSFWDGIRRHTIADIDAYGKHVLTGMNEYDEEETIDKRQASIETIMLALRTSSGLDLNRYEQEYGEASARELRRKTELLSGSGLVSVSGSRLHLVKTGFLLANEAISRLCE